MKKVIIKNSTLENKKKMAIFYEDGKKVKTTHFGAKGMSDYTKHKNDERKQRYLDRHRKRENWDNPMTAGALSRWILWNKKTLRESINDYKQKFNFH